MSEIDNPHDKLFGKSLEDSEAMRQFLSLNLPDNVKDKLNLDTLSQEPDYFVDGKMKDLFSDLIFNVELENGYKKGYIVNLLEHKSTVKKGVAFQLLKYMVRIWEKTENKDNLPLIIPIIFYHGQREWNISRNFSGLMSDNFAWADNLIPDFEYYIYTFGELVETIPEMTVPKLKLYIKNLRLTRSNNYNEFMVNLYDYLLELYEYVESEGDDEYFEVSIRYILERAESDIIEKDEIIEEVKRILPERSKKVMTIADELREEGKKEELANTVCVLLEQKFKDNLSENIKNKIKQADIDTLIEIRNNIFEINKLDRVKKILKGNY